MRRAAIAASLVLIAGAAHADRAKLAAARRAIEDVRYDDARSLLVGALTAGNAGPDEVREIYFLSAATAMVLGQPDVAERYYRRVLALDPDAQLPGDASPKLRPPFVAAQAFMAAHGRMVVRAERRGEEVWVTVVSDPVGMVASITALVDGKRAVRAASVGRPVVFSPRDTLSGITVLDEHGNALRAALPVGAAPVAERATPDPGRASPSAGRARRPAVELERPAPEGPSLARSWVTWAIPAVVLGGVGAGFAIDGQRSKQRLDEILAADNDHFLTDAERARARWKRDTQIATVAFAAGAVFAVTAVVMAATRPDPAPRTAIAPWLGGDVAGVAWSRAF